MVITKRIAWFLSIVVFATILLLIYNNLIYMPANHHIPAKGFLSHFTHYHFMIFLSFFDTIFKVLFILCVKKVIARYLEGRLNLLKVVIGSLLLLLAFFFMEDSIKKTLFPFYPVFHLIGFISLRIINLFLYIILLLIVYFIYAMRLWKNTEQQKRILVENQLSSELNFLKAQINPHFIFNSLNSFYSIAQQYGVKELQDGILKLSDLFRYNLYHNSEAFVTLSQEIHYLQDYIDVVRLKFLPEEINIEFSISGKTDDIVIAPMILLPFVENAFKHGTAVEKTSDIILELRCVENSIRFQCINSIYKNSEEETGVGLQNVKRRLAILYPGRHELQLQRDQNTFIVYLTIKL